MTQRTESLDFSGLFKLDVLVQLNIAAYSFYELGLKKFLALSSNKELVFLYINPQLERAEHKYEWDFVDNPIYCLCFEPSGTWVLIISEQKVLLVPFLPLFIPQNSFDHKWSLSRVTVLPLGNFCKPTTVAWWLTKESDNILIIGSRIGVIAFYSLETQNIIGEARVSDEISDLQICYDDSLDLLTLLITGSKSQQWKLILEHRSFGYNWLQQSRNAPDRDRRDGFMSYIKQLSKDKITLFTQGTSKESKPQTVEYVLKPTEYLPMFRKGSNNWALTSQYANGRHFLTAFETNEGTLILESPEQDVPSRTLRPMIKNDSQYMQGLWSQRLVYLLRNNELEVHSASFSVLQGDSLVSSKEHTVLWSAELLGGARRAHLVSARESSAAAAGWREPTFMCDLQLPSLALDQCLVVTTQGVYLLNTVMDPSEWLVGIIMRGGYGAEQSAAALGAPVPVLLRAAADMLLSRGKLAPAHYLYSLSQCQPDGWVARLGVFGRLQELSMYKPATSSEPALGNSAATIKLLSLLLKVANNNEETFAGNVKLNSLTQVELEELCSISACVGLWEQVPTFSIHRGNPSLLLAAIRSRGELCRGAIDCLLRQRSVVPMLLDENAQWLFDFIVEKYNKFDSKILKCLALWLCPLQDQLSPVVRDMRQGITTIYTTRMLALISTFMHVVCAIEARDPRPEINPPTPPESDTWLSQWSGRAALSCGLAHWAVAEGGNARVVAASTPVDTELVGRVTGVACGRHHTLLLTENGVYAAGDNSYGQLGVGAAWAGATGDAASATGALLHMGRAWDSPLVHVAAGHYHSAAVDLGGRLYTWGWGVHGQLGLGTIDDEWTPQLVTKLQGRKVLSVGCGACHTVVLTKNGEVYSFGASVFGQLGVGSRNKSCVPIRTPLADPAQQIAVGYFHNLALTTKGQLWVWGGSPQSVRAAHARRTASPSSPPARDPPPDPHLAPMLVDLCNVQGRIAQIAAGWHHSCIVNNAGTLYTWGLNFDGQLGSGDRKQICVPTEITINKELPTGQSEHNNFTPTASAKANASETNTKALVACGGDFTIYIDDEGKIYSAGNSHQEHTNTETNKAVNRVIMMKTTKRVIKIPASRTNNKHRCFWPIDRLDIMFPFDINDYERTPIKPNQNPLKTLADFKRKTWPDEVILQLKSWINEDSLTVSYNMAAKFAFHSQKYADCLRLLLDNLKYTRQDDNTYLSHTEVSENELLNKDSKESMKKNELKIVISNIMAKRIKQISLTILNDEPYPAIDPAIYKSLPCCCDELKYLPKKKTVTSVTNITDKDMSIQAANIIDKCMSIFPVDAELWETCFRLAKNYFLTNALSVGDLEIILRKYMELNASTMASAIMYSNDCVQYNKILSPKFYLNMCSEIMDAWG